MARFLTTLPENLGFYNLGTIQAYPTGGTGPTGYGPTSYFGSDPLPAIDGDSIYNPINLGDFSSPLRTVTLNNSHGGLSRRQTTFYKIRLNKPRSIQFTQNFSQFSYENKTNRNTLLAFYRIEDGTHKVELPINDIGYAYFSSGIDYDDDTALNGDYPSTFLPIGDYLFLITNDIRYQETTYSISVNVAVTDFRFVAESIVDSLDFRFVSEAAEEFLDFGSVAA